MPKIIALTGPKGSGKDTVGTIITEMYPEAQTIAFADPVKKQIQHLFDLNTEWVDQYDQFKRTDVQFTIGAKNKSLPGRHLVREIGMLMRSYDEQQFVNYVMNVINGDPSKLWVVTDLRFDNEYIALKSAGAKIIKITRPHYAYDGHITERAFDDHLVDHIMMNDGDLQHLKIRVDIVTKNILKEFQ